MIFDLDVRLNTKVTDPSIWDIRNRCKGEEEICLVISKGLYDLIWLQRLVLNPSLVRTKPLNSQFSLVF